ncbi:hypothetical protein EH223_01030 [candidate division KSB1 bacterium]|nr:hypothetical protein [candidate division KSB1 bacterium]RQW06980.1 MAG: hypothetical protein EH223_01030 [candidate division KSB1 bacterium]
MKKVKLHPELYKKAIAYAEQAGYPSLDDFIAHLVEKECARIEEHNASAEQVEKKLRGLGYLA